MDDKTRKFTCVICNYYCSRNAHLKNHLSSKKHIRNSQPNNIKDNDFKFECKCCSKKYKGQSGLWHHKKKCIPVILAEVPEVGNVSKSVTDIDVLINESNSTNSEICLKELKKLIGRIDTLSNDVNSMQIAPINVNNTITNNTNFSLNVFLNETCKNAINLDSFIKNLKFEMIDPNLMIDNYVDGTCSILQKNLDGLPLNKRPLHCMEGGEPNQQLMHIRQDDKWNVVGTNVNWLEQIYADDDDDVVNKNPIYYALKKIDDEKLKYLRCNYNDNDEYKIHHGRLNRETSRQDLKKEVYTKLLKIITIDPDILLSQ